MDPLFGLLFVEMRSLIPTSCKTCLIYQTCGGHDLPLLEKIGCVSVLDPTCIKPDRNDMNPHDEDLFWEKWNDVNGLIDLSISSPINGPILRELPRYIPKIHDGYSRNSFLFQNWAGLSLHDILSAKRKSKTGKKFISREELCRHYKIHSDSKIIGIGVDHDKFIEPFWKMHRSHELPEAIRKLGIDVVTTPNFSLFTDVSGFQLVRNIKRILLSAQRLSEAGVSTIIHVNAFRPGHWEIWRKFLLDHKEVSVIAKEFQTGAGATELLALADLQNLIGRPLHPLLIGGGRFYNLAKKHFESFTIADSKPFMAAANREVLSKRNGRFVWERHPTERGQSIEGLLANNIALYSDYLEKSEEECSVAERAGPIGQLELGLDISTPYLTRQPVAFGISLIKKLACEELHSPIGIQFDSLKSKTYSPSTAIQ